MKLRVLAVSAKPPAWVIEGWNEYARRMPRELPLELIEIKPEPRTTGKTAEAIMAAEAHRVEAKIPANAYRVVLDENGDAPTTRQLADRLEKWMSVGREIAFIIGGTDGLDEQLKRDSHETVRLSSLTLPHALVRVVLAEALYRATSLLKNHPYHRE